ncbi:MAG: class I SAM-dependent methyltransferase [Lachnospiraceae bacterium]|nr:class I SAM-dependent methyltransferase [Lachnospiraceae bacterium]
MNTVWSDYIQGIKTLYYSRKLRFDDLFFAQYQGLFGLDRDKEMKILEIGCGPGALAEALRRWYPKAKITAIDRDSQFIAFARENIAGVEFCEGDATALPFADNTFDVTISNTVQEHVEPKAFWGEQLRVLKPGGICLCLSARKGVSVQAPCLAETAEEKAFWEKTPSWEETRDAYQVCQYPMTEAEIPASMEANGFCEVATGYAVIDLTPDNPRFSAELAEAMIEAQRQTSLEAIESAHMDGDEAVVAAVNAKYDERIRLYRQGKKQWDTATSVTMVIRGRKDIEK